MRTEYRRKAQFVILVVFFLSIVLLGIFLYKEYFSSDIASTNTQITETNAAELVTPWKFIILGDTQASPDKYPFDIAFPMMVAAKPEMAIHVGDFNFEFADQQPASGLLSLQYWRQNQISSTSDLVEIHVTPGNHDDGDGGTLYKKYIDAFCYGKYSLSTGEEIVKAPYNTEISKIAGYCDADSVRRYYSFIRGNIKFILLDFQATGNDSEKEWYKEQVCDTDGTSVTLTFLHECAFDNETDTIPQLVRNIEKACPNNNLKAVIAGHGHAYVNWTDSLTGVTYLETQGFFWIRTNDELYNGWYEVEVDSDELVFNMYKWDMRKAEPDAPVTVLTIPGSFTDYKGTSSDNISEKWTSSVKTGLNFVSIPMSTQTQLTAKTIMEKFDSVSAGSIKSISYYDNSWVTVKTVNGKFVGNDFPVDPDVGYVLSATKDAQVDIAGTKGNAIDETLRVGWHLVAANKSQKASELIADYADKGLVVSKVEKYSSGKYVSFIIDNNETYGDDFAVEPGKGYFVYIEEFKR